MMLYNYFIHKGEEKCICDKKGSGILYFTGCNMHCCYCNIYKASQENKGYLCTAEQLKNILMDFQDKGCNNINIVNPHHWAEEIVFSVLEAKKDGFSLPVVYNSNGYDSKKILSAMQKITDIYLVDYKYASEGLARFYSKVDNYPGVFLKALNQMFQNLGPIVFNKKRLLTRGIIIRHLMLPNNIKDSFDIIDNIYKLSYKNKLLVSILNQYLPEYRAFNERHLGRRIDKAEYIRVMEYALFKKIKLAG